MCWLYEAIHTWQAWRTGQVLELHFRRLFRQDPCINKIQCFCLIWWFFISVHARTADQFYLVWSLFSVERLLRQHSQSALCGCKLPECYFLQALEWAAPMMRVSCMWPTCCVVGYLWNVMIILNVCIWILDPIPCLINLVHSLTPYFLHINFSIVFIMVPVLTITLFSLGFLINIMSGFLIRSPYSEYVILFFKQLM